MNAEAHHVVLWKRITQALRERNAFIEGTPIEIAKHARHVLGTELVELFVNEYYLERQFGDGTGGIADAEAEALVTDLESLPQAIRMPSSGDGTSLGFVSETSKAGFESTVNKKEGPEVERAEERAREKAEVSAFLQIEADRREAGEREQRLAQKTLQRNTEIWALADLIGAYIGTEILCRVMAYNFDCAEGRGLVFYSALIIGFVSAGMVQKVGYRQLSPLTSLIIAFLGGSLAAFIHGSL